MSAARGRLAVIPARGGSKRIPGKNLVPLAGPAAARLHRRGGARERSVRPRRGRRTDSEEIAEAARRTAPRSRSCARPRLSDDIVPVSAATVDALERLDPAGDGIRLGLPAHAELPAARRRATSSPAMSSSRRTGAEAQISVVRYGWQNPWWAMRRGDDFTLDAALRRRRATARSQDLPELFCPTGAVWWAQGRRPAARGHLPHGRAGPAGRSPGSMASTSTPG